MATSAERQVLGFLLLVALGGGAMRLVEAHRLTQAVQHGVDRAPAARGASRALDAQRRAVDSIRAVTKPAPPRSNRRAAALTSKLPKAAVVPFPETAKDRPVRPLDVNSASATELEALPRVGPALAARIIAWRQAHGPFGSTEDLRHVRGIGPATARRLTPLVTFSGRHSP